MTSTLKTLRGLFGHREIVAINWLTRVGKIPINIWEVSTAIGLDHKQIVTFKELFMRQVVQQEALTMLLVKMTHQKYLRVDR